MAPTPDFVLRLREHVGHAPLWLSGSTAVVLDDDRVLLVRRADTGAWTPISGIVDPGEHPATTAVREALEEAGVVIEVEALVRVHVLPPTTYGNGDVTQYLDLVHRCRHVSGEPHVADEESVDVRWFALDALPPMSDDMLARLDAAVAFDGTVRLA
ncbi:NUDIX domain-containing protein [Agrococcus versicolor]|uniref:NUDIX domain-containing protein n=1 Tax=Agrococcus versicolor TaxID=501482 RepID=A0ABN3AP51_9MICO